MSKRKAQQRHARRRARERYGIELGRSTRQEIITAIHGGRSTFIRRQSHRVTVHDVLLDDGDHVRVVYDSQRHEVVTFLPRPFEAS